MRVEVAAASSDIEAPTLVESAMLASASVEVARTVVLGAVLMSMPGEGFAMYTG